MAVEGNPKAEAGDDKAFTVGQTHGILWRDEHEIEQSSDGLGWSSLYCSMQRERPYEGSFDAIKDHLVIVHRDGPVTVTRRLGGEVVKKSVAPGGLFILPAEHQFSVELGGSLSTIHIYVRSQWVEKAAKQLFAGGDTDIEIVPRLGVFDPLIEQAAYAACELMQDRVTSDWAVEGLARTIAVRLLRAHSTASQADEAMGAGLSPDRLRHAKEFIAENLEKAISLADMAESVRLSPVYFARLFKRSTGQSPHQYLLAQRVMAAKRLLYGDLPIAEIAYRCGFSHQEHLTRMFRRELGITPGAYRKASGAPQIGL